MAGIAAYFSLTLSRHKQQWSTRILIFLIHLLIFPGIRTYAQSETKYDEISVFLEVPKLGAREIDALIKENEIFLPVTHLFDFLNIRNIPSTGFETITGYFIDKESSYSIDRNKNEIQYGGKLFKLKAGDLIHTESNLYLRAFYFEKIFGLECIYSFKDLSVKVESQLEIPVIREMRQEDLRVNLNRLTSEEKADIEIRRFYPSFRFGMADWSVLSTQQINGPSETRINLSLGSVIVGGEATASLNYNSNEPFQERQQHYLWRYVDNYNSTLSQVTAGKISPLSTSTILDPVVGVQFTNAPTTLRKSSGSYTLSDITEPNWIVELYVNNVLVEYAKADAAGFFTFEVPLVYGNLPLKLKFYGPWGEEKSRERDISLPFSFVPKEVLEYDISAGIVEDSLRSRLLRTNINFGVSKNVTIGAGYEYLSSVTSSPAMPFVKGSFRLASNLILSGELTYKVRAKSTLSYRLPSNIQFDLNYSKYNKEQQAINHNYLEERNVSILMPISLNSFHVYNKMTLNQIVLPTTDSTTAEWLLSGSLFGVNTNITTSGLFIGGSDPYVYSKLSLSYRFKSGLRITPMAQYGYSDKRLMSLKIGLEKKLIKHAYLNLSFEQDFTRNLQNAELGFRYNFNFAQTGISGIRSENKTSLVQYARGSIISDRNTNYFKADKISNVGKGGITIIPYFDKNSNSRRDSGEAKVFGLNLRSSGGQIERIEQDTTIRILSLEAYTKCIIEFDDSGFENPPLKMKNRTYSVHVDPNMLKVIEVPLSIAGEASGIVRINWGDEIRGLDGIVSHLYNKDQKLVGRVFSNIDGSYKFDGLSLGSYVVRIDSIQLQRIGMTCTPDSIKFDISSDSGGATVNGLDFLLELTPEPQEEKPDLVETIIPEPKVQITKRDSTYIKIHELVQEVSDTTDSYAIQLGAFSKRSNAKAYKEKLAKVIDREIEIIIENGLFKVRVLDFESRKEVDEFIPKLSNIGVKEMWVINLKGIRKQMMLMTVRDTITEVIEIRTEMLDPNDHSNLNIQLGAFRDSSRAEALRLKLSNSIDQAVIIIKEFGYFKVRLTGFTKPEQRDAIIPQLSELGISDIWVLPYDTSRYETGIRAQEEVLIVTETDSVIVIEDEILEPQIAEEELLEEEVVAEEELLEEELVEEEVAEEELLEEELVEEVVAEEELLEEELVEEVVAEEELLEEELVEEEVAEEELLEEELVEEVVAEEEIEVKSPIEDIKVVKPIIEQPRFSIQAGVFTELSEARRAQRRIKNNLGLQSVLVEEYDYTRVIIPGFYKREDTYKYYPELAGLGYSNIMVIEKRK